MSSRENSYATEVNLQETNQSVVLRVPGTPRLVSEPVSAPKSTDGQKQSVRNTHAIQRLNRRHALPCVTGSRHQNQS